MSWETNCWSHRHVKLKLIKKLNVFKLKIKLWNNSYKKKLITKQCWWSKMLCNKINMNFNKKKLKPLKMKLTNWIEELVNFKIKLLEIKKKLKIVNLWLDKLISWPIKNLSWNKLFSIKLTCWSNVNSRWTTLKISTKCVTSWFKSWKVKLKNTNANTKN